MSPIYPTLLNPELVKIEVGEFRSLNIEREKNMEMELVNLVREREWLRKEVDLLEKTQSYTELVKCSVEEKLGRSERRCEELEEKIKKIGDLRRNEIDELRVKKMESEKAAEFYKSRVDELEPRMVKVETALAKVLNVNLPNLDKLVAAAIHGNGGIGLAKKGGRNLGCSGIEEDVTNVVSGRASKAAKTKGRLLDNEDKNERLSQAEGVLESLLRKVDQPILDIGYDGLPRNGFPWVDDGDDVSSATLRRHITSGSNLVSTNIAAGKQARALSELANDNPEMNAHLVQSEMTQMQPLVGRCPSSAAVDVMIISDDDDNEDNEVVGASDSSQSKDSDDEFLSDRYMNNFVAELKRKALGNEY